MAKKELLFGAVAALILSGAAAPAFAAKDEGRHHHRHGAMIERLDTDKNGKVSLDEAKASASAAFKAFDTDGNGAISKDEIKARRAAFKEARKAVHNAAEADKDKARDAMRAGGPYMLPGAGKRFDRTDADKSGTLSEAEVLASAEKMFERRDSNKDGAIDTADARPGKGKWHHGKRAEHMLKRLDADKDGKLSKDEMLARATRTFQRADADKNGEVTKAEMETAAAARFQKRDRNGDGFITADEMGRHHKK